MDLLRPLAGSVRAKNQQIERLCLQSEDAAYNLAKVMRLSVEVALKT